MKNLDWANLSFGYMKTDYNVRCYYRDGKWGEIEVCSDEYLKLHMAATCLHYGQEAFEGLKAYRCKDGKILSLNSDELEELNSLMNDYGIRNSEIRNGKIELESYRTLALDRRLQNSEAGRAQELYRLQGRTCGLSVARSLMA